MTEHAGKQHMVHSGMFCCAGSFEHSSGVPNQNTPTKYPTTDSGDASIGPPSREKAKLINAVTLWRAHAGKVNNTAGTNTDDLSITFRTKTSGLHATESGFHATEPGCATSCGVVSPDSTFSSIETGLCSVEDVTFFPPDDGVPWGDTI